MIKSVNKVPKHLQKLDQSSDFELFFEVPNELGEKFLFLDLAKTKNEIWYVTHGYESFKKAFNLMEKKDSNFQNVINFGEPLEESYFVDGWNFFIKQLDQEKYSFILDEDNILNDITETKLNELLQIVKNNQNNKKSTSKFKIKYEISEVLFKEDVKKIDDLYTKIWLKYLDENNNLNIKYVSWPGINLLKARKTKDEEQLIRKAIVTQWDLIELTQNVLDKYSNSKDFEKFFSLIEKQSDEWYIKDELFGEDSKTLCNSFTKLFEDYITENILKRGIKNLEELKNKDLLEDKPNKIKSSTYIQLSKYFTNNFSIDLNNFKKSQLKDLSDFLAIYLNLQFNEPLDLNRIKEPHYGLDLYLTIKNLEKNEIKSILDIFNKNNPLKEELETIKDKLWFKHILKKDKFVFVKTDRNECYWTILDSNNITPFISEEEFSDFTISTEEEKLFKKLFNKFINKPDSVSLRNFTEKDFDYIINFDNNIVINEDVIYTINDFLRCYLVCLEDANETSDRIKYLKKQINAIREYYSLIGEELPCLTLNSFFKYIKNEGFEFEQIAKAWPYLFFQTDMYTRSVGYMWETDCDGIQEEDIYGIYLHHPDPTYKEFWEYLIGDFPTWTKLLKAPSDYVKTDYSKAIQLLTKSEIATLGDLYEVKDNSTFKLEDRDINNIEEDEALFTEENQINLTEKQFTNYLMYTKISEKLNSNFKRNDGLYVKVNDNYKYFNLEEKQLCKNIEKEEYEQFENLFYYLIEHPEKQKFVPIYNKPAFKNLNKILFWKDKQIEKIYLESQFEKIQISPDVYLKRILIPLNAYFYISNLSFQYDEGAIFEFENKNWELFTTDFIRLENLEETMNLPYKDLFGKELLELTNFSEEFIFERLNKTFFSLNNGNEALSNEINLFSSYKLKTLKLDLQNFIELFSKDEKSLSNLKKIENLKFKINLNYNFKVNQEQEGLTTNFFWKDFIEYLVKEINNFSLDINKSLNFLNKEIKNNDLFKEDFNFIFSTVLAEVLQISWDPLKSKYIEYFTINFDDDDDLERIWESLRIIIKQNNLEFCNKFIKLFLSEMNNQFNKQSDIELFYRILEFYLEKVLIVYFEKYNNLDIVKDTYTKYLNINDFSILFLTVILKLKEKLPIELDMDILLKQYLKNIKSETERKNSFDEYEQLKEFLEETISLLFKYRKNEESYSNLNKALEFLNETNNLILLKRIAKPIINLFRKNSLEINKGLLKNIFKFINFKGEINGLEKEELENLLFFNVEESNFKTIRNLIIELLDKTDINPESLFNFIENYKLRDYFENKWVETINLYTEFILKVKNKNFDGKENLAFKIIHQIFWKENVNTEQIMNKVAELWQKIFKISENIQNKFLDIKKKEDKNKNFLNSIMNLFWNKDKKEKISSNKDLSNDLTLLLEEGISELETLLKDLKKTKDVFENLELTTKNLKSQLSELNSFKDFFKQEELFNRQFNFLDFYNNNENKLIKQSKDFYNLKIRLLEMDVNEFEQQLRISIVNTKK